MYIATEPICHKNCLYWQPADIDVATEMYERQRVTVSTLQPTQQLHNFFMEATFYYYMKFVIKINFL